jgi:hypothetical protein
MRFLDRIAENIPLTPMKGGGGGGGSTNTVEKADPWEGQQPFLEYGFQQAQDRFQSDSPNFFPGNTISPFNQNETAYQQSVIDYLGSGRGQGLQAGAENAIGNELFNTSNNPMLQATRGLAPYGQESLVAASNFTDSPILDEGSASPLMQQMLSGSVSQNPFIENANQAMVRDAVSGFQQEVMPALRASQIAYQPGGSSRGDIAGGLAASNLQSGLTDKINQNYMNAFNSAQQQQMGAAQLLEQGRAQRAGEAFQQGQGAFGIGLGGEGQINQNLATGLGGYGAVSQQPIDLAGNLSDVGMQQRELAQQNLDEDVNRFQFDQNIGDQKLANYMNLIQGNFGGTTVNTAERGGLGLAGSMGQLGGAIGAIGGLFG